MGNGGKLFGKQICHKNMHILIKYFCIVEIIIHYQILVWLISSEIKVFLMYTLKQLFYNYTIFRK